MTSFQLKRDQREDKITLMISPLTPAAGSLFRLLSTNDWKAAGSPKLPALTKKILEGQDSNRALGELKSLLKPWTGKNLGNIHDKDPTLRAKKSL